MSEKCAFPIGDSKGALDEGMTLRDYFAAKAMQAFISDICNTYSASDAAGDAYKMANAMLKERENV